MLCLKEEVREGSVGDKNDVEVPGHSSFMGATKTILTFPDVRLLLSPVLGRRWKTRKGPYCTRETRVPSGLYLP